MDVLQAYVRDADLFGGGIAVATSEIAALTPRHVRTRQKQTFEAGQRGRVLTPCRHRRSKLFALRDAGQQRFRNGEAERFGGLEVNDQLDFWTRCTGLSPLRMRPA
jgi:hypothetical protein